MRETLQQDKKISVIIPVYNIAEYLPRCLDSVLNQTYKNLEVVVVDDGSTDNSVDVIEEYAKKDSRIVKIFKKNTGVSDTRNKGIDTATGDYITFVDGDDYIEPDMYEILMNNALKYDADISHCGYQMVFPSRVDYYYNTGEKFIQDNKKGIIDLLKGERIEPSPCNKLYKRSVIKDERMPSDIRNNEDYLFNVMVFKNAQKSVFEDKPLYHYILRENSATTSAINEHKMFDGEIVRERIAQCFKDYDTNDNEIYHIALNNLLRSEITIIRTFATNKSAKVFSHRKKEFKLKIKKLYADMKNKGILSRRAKIDCILILYCPVLFNIIYKLYNFISGVDKKYEVK